MAVRLCECGFANRPDAKTCAACGEELHNVADERASETPSTPDAQTVWMGDGDKPSDLPVDYEAFAADAPESTIVLTCESDFNVAPVTVPAPGGTIGRAGDFSPQSFSPRVSGIHARLEFADGAWSIEHLGRNSSLLLRAGTWIDLPKGRPIGVLDGDKLRLADMLFAVSVESAARQADVQDCCGNGSEAGAASADEDGEAQALSDAAQQWVVTCPVCGARYVVEDELSRVEECETCSDALDKRRVASARARLEAAPS